MSFFHPGPSKHRRASRSNKEPSWYIFPRIFLGSVLLIANAAGASEAPEETLIIFTQPEADSLISRSFETENLPQLKATAEQLGVPIKVLDARRGAPEEVRITPLLIHQSANGRSFFQGRYADPGKVAHFIRTSRAVPATSETLKKTEVVVWSRGRSRVYSPLKITDLAGELPAGFNSEDFRKRATRAVISGFKEFKQIDTIELGPTDRAFYMDFYPYRSDDGRLFISLGLFSQFNCIEPVFTEFEQPINGNYNQLADVFARAGRLLEQQVDEQISSSALGDGFDPIPDSTTLATWESLGLKLPERSAANVSSTAFGSIADLPRSWRIAPALDRQPRLIFRFPAPLERYSGEAAEISGFLRLAEGNSLQGAEGWIEVDTGSVTMGEPSLDQAIHQKMIHIARFPASRFSLKKVLPETEELAFGRATRLQAEGTFELMGQKVDLQVRGDVEPVFAEDSEPRLRVRAAFEIRLASPFGISGPDGPAPANDTLKFYLDFLMEAHPDPPT